MKYINQCYGDCLEGIGIKNPRWFVKDTEICPRVGDIVHCVKDTNYLDQYIKVVLSHDKETGKFTVGSRYADSSKDFTFVPEKIFGVVTLMFDGDKRLVYERRCGEVKRQRIDKCPHCNSDWGVFVKMDLINVPKNLNFDGTDAYNGEMYDNAEKIIEKPTVYCQKCGKAIGRWDKFCASNDIVPF